MGHGALRRPHRPSWVNAGAHAGRGGWTAPRGSGSLGVSPARRATMSSKPPMTRTSSRGPSHDRSTTSNKTMPTTPPSCSTSRWPTTHATVASSGRLVTARPTAAATERAMDTVRVRRRSASAQGWGPVSAWPGLGFRMYTKRYATGLRLLVAPLMRPLYLHAAQSTVSTGLLRWARWGSNPRPSDYESPALTTELQAPGRLLAPGVGIEPTNLSVNSRLLCQLSYPGPRLGDSSSPATSPITARWVLEQE
jgi:hypothetical protein